MPVTETIPLHETARKRYLNYALSVITSRALPDIRDGLKPVQRRILYAMFDSLNLYPNKRHRKSATVVGECFVKDTLVATEEGLRPVQEIRRGENVYTESGLQPVTECFEMPARPLCRLELSNGASNTVTPNQPMRVLTDELQLKWREASGISSGDWLVLKKEVPFPDQQVSLPPFKGKPIQLTPNLGYLLGHLMADGWVSADYGRQNRLRVGFCSMDPGVIERVRSYCQEVFGKAPSHERKEKGLHVARINSTAINGYLSEVFNLGPELGAHHKFIPDAILQSPASVAWAFIAGLFDGDGSLGVDRTRARYVSTSSKLIDQLQVLLQHLGIPSKQSLLHSNPTPCEVLTVRGEAAKTLAYKAPFQRETLCERASELSKKKTYQSQFDRVPNGAGHVFQELSDLHEGGGWYRDTEGKAFRQGIAYPDGTKIRYSDDLQDRPLSFSQLEEWGIFSKLERIGSPLFDTIGYFRKNELFFVQVEAVTNAPPEKTYDLQVASDHNFVANGMVAHNCMGKYHPHGDKAIYDAMVRMAQPFSLRSPLVDGHGNFGSIDGDNAAAMRYTEAKLRPLAMEMLEELREDTVDYRDNFDGTLEEPVVLPSRVPNLLVNGASGIAVGMATNIPPHNLGEVVDAALHVIEEPDVSTQTLVREHIQGPDFPTGGRLLNTQDELEEIYETGRGTIEMRGAFRKKGKTRAIIESVPYGVDKSKIVEEIADHIAEENVPQLSNVRDESTDDVRIVLELKRGSDTEAAMAYLYKHTALQKRFHVNLTCLVPTEDTDVKAPRRVDLRTILRHFLDFRMEVVTRRLHNELEALENRIHILEGFETIFDALDEAIKIIRASKNKADAAQRLMHRFQLDADQTDAILETRLYKLSQMEIEAIREELEEKRARAEEIRHLLDDESARWGIVEEELREVRDEYADERRSTIVGPEAEMEYTEEDYIVDEDVHVIVTRDGWVKRQGTYTDLDSIRTRDGDEVGWVLPGSTRASVGFFTNYGTCYTTRIADIPSTTGYGDPVQKLFSFDDGEYIVGVVSFDDRALPDPVPPEPSDQGDLFDPEDPAAPEHPYVIAITKGGQATRFTLDGFQKPSTRTGRMYMRLEDGDEVVRAHLARGDENVCLASHDGRALIFPVYQVSVYKGPAKGVRAIRLEGDDRVLDFALSTRARQGLAVETNNGREEIVRTTKFDVTNRGAKGTLVIKRGYFAEVFPKPVEVTLDGES